MWGILKPEEGEWGSRAAQTNRRGRQAQRSASLPRLAVCCICACSSRIRAPRIIVRRMLCVQRRGHRSRVCLSVRIAAASRLWSLWRGLCGRPPAAEIVSCRRSRLSFCPFLTSEIDLPLFARIEIGRRRLDELGSEAHRGGGGGGRGAAAAADGAETGWWLATGCLTVWRRADESIERADGSGRRGVGGRSTRGVAVADDPRPRQRREQRTDEQRERETNKPRSDEGI